MGASEPQSVRRKVVLPWPLSPDDADARAVLDLQADLLGDGAVLVADRHLLDPHRRALARLDAREAEVDPGLLAGHLDHLQPFELLRLAAGLAGRVGVGAVLDDEPLELLPLGGGGGVLPLVVLATLVQVLQVGVDVAGEQGQLAAGEFQRVGAGLLEKRPIVRHHQDARLEVAQEVLQQHLRAQVEEVGRLVEHQQVRVVQQQGRQLDAGLPTAREFVDGADEHIVRQRELPGDLPAAPLRLAAVAHQELHHRLARLERIVLPQIAQPQTFGLDHFARVEFLFAQQDPAERRLAGAVAANQANLLVIGQGAGGPVQQQLVAVAFVGVLQSEDDGHRGEGEGRMLGG